MIYLTYAFSVLNIIAYAQKKSTVRILCTGFTRSGLINKQLAKLLVIARPLVAEAISNAWGVASRHARFACSRSQ